MKITNEWNKRFSDALLKINPEYSGRINWEEVAYARIKNISPELYAKEYAAHVSPKVTKWDGPNRLLTKEDINKYATEAEKKILEDSNEFQSKAPKEVRSSQYGCRNCLWAGVECKQGSMYIPYVSDGRPSCKNYTYYD